LKLVLEVARIQAAAQPVPLGHHHNVDSASRHEVPELVQVGTLQEFAGVACVLELSHYLDALLSTVRELLGALVG
jgi:hypothetical protein